MRLGVAVAAALLATAAAPAVAGPTKRSCELVVDERHDDHVVGGLPGGNQTPSAPDLDIVSADIASDSRQVTGVVRVRELGATTAQASTGAGYEVGFSIGADRFLLGAHRTAEGSTRFFVAHVESRNGTAESALVLAYGDGVFDDDTSEIPSCVVVGR